MTVAPQAATPPVPMRALARIPPGHIHAVRLTWANVTVEEIRQLHKSGLTASIRVGFYSQKAVRKDPAKAFWYRTEAGDKALADALNGNQQKTPRLSIDEPRRSP